MYRIIFALILALSFPITSNAAEEFLAKIYPVLDESISTAPYPGSWNQQQPSVFGRLPNSRDGALDAYAATRSTSMGWIGIFRTFLSFDLSVIPNEAEISSVKLVVFPKYVVNDMNDSYSYMGLYRSYQASSTDLSFNDIELCGDSVAFPNELAQVNLTDLSPNIENNFEFSSEEANLLNDNRYLSLCLRVGHDSDNQEIRNNNTSYWRTSGIVIYGTKSEENYFQPYLEITYTVPEEEVTVASGVDKLKEYIAGLVSKAQRNSYTAQVKNILGFFETGKFTAALNQLGALLKKVEVDTAEGQLPPEVTEGITETATAIEEVIEVAAAATKGEVPLMTQIASPYPPESAEWAPLPYANGKANYKGSCGQTIAQCGCALTSFAMLGQSYGLTYGVDGSEATPPNIDAWLLANNGYNSKGEINWPQAVKYFGDARIPESTYLTYDETYTPSIVDIDTHLETKGPVILKTIARNRDGAAFEHFILGTDKVEDVYGVRDPLWYNTVNLDDVRDRMSWVQDYNNRIDGGRLFTFNKKAHIAQRAIEIRLASPAELVLTDSSGRRLGYNPNTEESYDEIPGGVYYKEAAVYSEELAASGETPHVTKVLSVTLPEDDAYTLEVIGTGAGEYTLSVLTLNEKGEDEVVEVTDVTTVGQVDSFIVDVEVGDATLTELIERIRVIVADRGDAYTWLLRRLDVLEDKIEKENLVAADAQVAVLLTQLANKQLSDAELFTLLEAVQQEIGQ